MLKVKKEKKENFNKSSVSSEEYMSFLSEDKTVGGETCIFRNALYVDSKAQKLDPLFWMTRMGS